MPKYIGMEVNLLSEKLMQDFLFFPDGEQLPSYRRLLKQYGCSRQTLTLVLERLKQKGYLRTEARTGMFLCEGRKSQKKRVLFLRVDWPCSHADLFSQTIRSEFKKRKVCAYSEIRYQTENLSVTLRKLDRSMADVIVLWLEKGDLEKISILSRLGIPVIFFDSGVSLYHAGILDLQQELFGMLAADYLLRHGHRRTAAILTEPLGLTCRKKLSGFLNYMRVNGLETEVIDCHLKNGEASEAQAEEFLNEYFQTHPLDFTGCFATNSDPLVSVLNGQAFPVADRFCIVNGNGLPASSSKFVAASIVFDVENAVKTLVDGVEAVLRGESFGWRCIPPNLIEQSTEGKESLK